jgi:hypothetical protein
MFEITDHAAVLEEKLASAFDSVTWIGELPITDRDFRILCDSVRSSNVRTTPPRVLLTAMVFCARTVEFKDDEPINFWGKFFEVVLRQPRSDALENEYRAAFRRARAVAQREHSFEFPTREQTHTEVVSGLYQHAILPAYLQNDFAAFFLRQYPDHSAWNRLHNLFADQIAAQNEANPPLPPTPKRLVNFLSNADTSMTAARLIKTLNTAVLWYADGLSSESIADILLSVERAIWYQIVPRLPKPGVGTLPPRLPSGRVNWAWLIEQNDILELNARNIYLEGDVPPDRLVWLPPDQAKTVKVGQVIPEYGRCYAEVNPYQTATGYTIDNAMVMDIDQEGAVVLVDQHDHALNAPIPTPSLPEGTPTFFRLQPDGDLALLSDINRLTDGEYAVSLPDGVMLTAEEGGSVQRIYPLLIPKVLKAQGHTNAARYAITLPIRVGDRRIDRQRSRLAPMLEGSAPVSGLVPGALAVYQAGEIALRFTQPRNIPSDRLFVRLTVNDSIHVYPLSEMDTAGQVRHETQNGQDVLHVRLEDRLPSVCLMQVEVFSGVSRMHGDPRLAGVLPPGVRITHSPVDRCYTPSSPPCARIEGVRRQQVKCTSDAQIEEDEAGVTVTWVDPRQEAALRLNFDGIELPLTFDVRWMYAWVSPLNGRFLWEDALDQAILSLRGAPRSVCYIAVAGGKPRRYQLNARGVMDVPVAHDALADMLRAYEGEHVPVQAWFDGEQERIDLFTFIRPQFSDFERQPEFVKGAVRAFKAYLRQGRREAMVDQAHLLPAVARMYIESVPRDALPEVLKPLAEIQPGSHAEARAILPTKDIELKLSEQLGYPVKVDAQGQHIFVIRSTSNGEWEVRVALEERADGELWLVASHAGLHQCARCGALFWSADRNAKFRHGHGQFGLDSRDLSKQAVVGHLKAQPFDISSLRRFSIEFEPYIQREVQRQYRKERGRAWDAQKQKPVLLFTTAAYTWATANWVLRLDNNRHLQRLQKFCNSGEWVNEMTEKLISQDDAALIVAGRWVRGEWEKRSQEGWAMLDPVVMTLAVLARAAAYDAMVLDDDDAQRVFSLLEHVHHACPELLVWALAWAELIFTHMQKDI